MSETARVALVAALFPISATALGDAATDTQALAKQTQHPIAHLISVPIQSNTNYGIGINDSIQAVHLRVPKNRSSEAAAQKSKLVPRGHQSL